MPGRLALIVFVVFLVQNRSVASPEHLVDLRKDERVGDLRVRNLYADSDRHIIGAKFLHDPTGAPIYLFQIETVPQAFMWIDAPANSNAGLAHALEHLLGGKGTTGRYLNLLRDMRLSRSAAATTDDFNMYSFSSGTGLPGFFEQFKAWLLALYKPDFSDLEAEREFYHFGTSLDRETRKERLIEEGSVYDEMQSNPGIYSYYFELNKRVLGDENPFGFYSAGVPAAMRGVTPKDIRGFHTAHYRLGPTTGFIFVLSPTEDAVKFLERVSQDIRVVLPARPEAEVIHPTSEPKYPIQPSTSTEISIYPFPSANESDPGEVRFGWRPIRTDSQAEVRLLQLLFRVLADGDKSILYKSVIDSKTREFDSGAASIESLVFLGNSPFFPAEFIGLSGIPGNRMTVDRVQQLRERITATITKVSQLPDGSQSLADFNRLAVSYAKAWRRSERVWSKSAPRFGFNYETEWKERLEYLEMDQSFVRSISDEPVWTAVEHELQSRKNVWRGLIQHFHLLDVPYATASMPSPQMQEQIEQDQRRRIVAKTTQLMSQFATTDEQQALKEFEKQEDAKTKEIDKIGARVVHPKFVTNPPLTPDEGINYEQFQIDAVPVIASMFERAPTIDVGLAFDLRKIPQSYYKYLPILPSCLDSLGLKTPRGVVTFDHLQAQIQAEAVDFSTSYDSNALSHRAELVIQVSTTTPAELKRTLALVEGMINFGNLDVSNSDRLRDIVAKRLWQEDTFNKGEDDYWFMNPAAAFRYQDDPLNLALSSVLTRAHWDSRLRWLLHEPVTPEQIAALGDFAEGFLSRFSSTSPRELSRELSRSEAKGLEGELIEYWGRSVSSFPSDDLLPGLRRLTREVQEDLKTGPRKTISDLEDLRRIALNRNSLRVVLTVDPGALEQVKPVLAEFVRSLPPGRPAPDRTAQRMPSREPLTESVRKRYHIPESDFPLYVWLEDSSSGTANLAFYADHPSYSDVDQRSLLRVLSTKLVSGSGPHTLYTKTGEGGLAYSSSITSDPSLKMIRYYATRCPDVAALIDLVNSVAAGIARLNDASLVDYALQKAFPLPRSMSTFADRGRGIARDIRDGNDPATVRRFYQGILKLRNEPNLLQEITDAALPSISPVLVDSGFREQQREARSLFFFVGPEKLLADTETRLHLPGLLRVYPSDFWIDFQNESDRSGTVNKSVH